MTVAELIAKLLQFDQNLPVTIASYEFGFDDLEEVSKIDVESTEFPDYVPTTRFSNGARKTVVCIGPKDPSLQNSPRR